MSRVFTYSFEDTTLTIQHPDFGVYSAYGHGLGKVTVAYENDIAESANSIDLTVVISKHAYKNGTVSITVKQASDFAEWMKKFVNKFINSDVEKFALAEITIKNKTTSDIITCTGICPSKHPDTNFDSTAEDVTWSFIAANIDRQ